MARNGDGVERPASAAFAESLFGDNATGWNLGRLVAKLHPGQFVLDGVQSPFDLLDFAREGKCEATLAGDVHSEMHTRWKRGHGLSVDPVNAVYDVTWQKHRLRVVNAEWRVGWDQRSFSLVVAPTEETARAFALAVCEFCNDPRRSVLRFSGGCWSRSRELWSQIQDASFDDLVLAGDLKNQIRDDFAAFLAAKEQYERYGLPHKRGVLFLGPPGNGKTHCLRAVIKFLGVPCLYVMSLKDRYRTDDANIDAVFERAREITPCCLVFEDLDAMITDENRSYFLNQLDGLASLSGVLTLATTNHPDRLDPAIVERPSRFDRKYHFNLPAQSERREYLRSWNAKLDPAMAVTAAELDALVQATDGFSFAYLKELYLSAMVRWMVDRKPGTMAAELRGQLDALRTQMKTAATAPPAKPASKGKTDWRAALGAGLGRATSRKQK